MNFFKDLSDELSNFFISKKPTLDIESLILPLPALPSNYPERLETESHRLYKHRSECLLERYFTWKKRHLPNINYQIFYSKELIQKIDNNDVDQQYLSTINVIKNELEQSIDITPRLSRKINKIKTNDSMLYDWNIYHFHLKNTKAVASQYFYDRSGPLLFAYIPTNDNTVYFLDILKSHDDLVVFANQNLISIIGQKF